MGPELTRKLKESSTEIQRQVNPLWVSLASKGIFDSRLAILSLKYDKRYLDNLNVESIDQLVRYRGHQLSFIQLLAYRGLEATQAIIEKILKSELRFLQRAWQLPEDEYTTLANRIIGRFKGLTPADLKLCLSNLIEGHYGEIKGSVDGSLILSAIVRFKQDLHNRLKASNSEKDPDHPVPMPPEIKEAMESLARRLSAGRAPRPLPTKEIEIRYHTLSDYCEAKQIDEIDFMERFEESVTRHAESMKMDDSGRDALREAILRNLLYRLNEADNK